jgi:hypothetical protein
MLNIQPKIECKILKNLLLLTRVLIVDHVYHTVSESKRNGADSIEPALEFAAIAAVNDKRVWYIWRFIFAE